MTWKEFKDQAEAEGVTDKMQIWYIDFSFKKPRQLHVELEDDDDPQNVGLRIW